MEDKFKTNKPLYDYRIEFDTSKLDDRLQNYIKKLEKYDEDGDWFNYDLLFDEFEIELKGYVRHKKITDNEYKILLRKYGWLYD